jgi:hypothetical protein
MAEILLATVYFLGEHKILTTLLVLAVMVTVGVKQGKLFKIEK